MSEKKAKKPVMGYDPLAWLKPEENAETSVGEPVEPEVADITETASVSEPVEPEEENSKDATVEVESTIESSQTEQVLPEQGEQAPELNNAPEVDAVANDVITEPTAEQNEMDNESPEAESTPSTSDNVLEIKFESRANISQTEELYKSLRESLTEHQHIKFDASEVEVVDTAILQLLVCFIQEVKNISGSFEWSGVSDNFVESAKLIDVDQKLDIAV